MRPKVVLLGCAAIAVAIAAVAVLSPSGLRETRALREEQRTLEEDVARARAQNARIAAEVQVLQGEAPESQAALDKAVREELGWVRHDEVVLTLPEERR